MKDATKTVTAGRKPHAHRGVVNTPVYRASTILADSLADYRAMGSARAPDALVYGRHGTPTHHSLEAALAELEGGASAHLCASGLAAITAPLLSFLSAGDHLLMADSCYSPTRRFCDGMLRRLGVETTYYDPLIGGGVRSLIQQNTRVIFMESPGSWTFEMQDVPAIAAVANDAGIWTMIDNTWATPLYFRPLEHGVDVSIQAATKYISGHADVMLGAAVASKAAESKLKRGFLELGVSVGPDDAYLAARGLRTLAVRMERHWASGLRVAEWLFAQPEVVEVIHPALPWDPGHRIWKRDFAGSSGLFAIVLRPDLSNDAALTAMCDGFELFGMGASWGGFESLITPGSPGKSRSATSWPRNGRPGGQVMRLSIGLEDPDDLIEDLRAGFERMRALGA
ncbi:MAG: cystathionine beta-lyase [Neomegalonema sp.]|nr:cystathionine beta-lyase [Neomegalonema sp.]